MFDKTHVTTLYYIVVKYVYNFTRETSKIWKNVDRVLYSIVYCYSNMCIGGLGHIHLLAIIIIIIFYTTICECMIYYGPM